MQDIYFNTNYISIYEKLGEGRTISFVYINKDKKATYPFLINSVNDLYSDLDKEYFDIQSAYGYNGVLTNSYDNQFIEGFYNEFYNYCAKNNIIAEFTRFHPIIGNQEFSKNHMQVIFNRETITLNLQQDYSTIWNKEYSSKNRNMIRKAQSLDYSINIISEPTVQEVEQFVSIYYNNMKMLEAEDYYFFNSNYFFNLFSQLKGFVYLINVKDKRGLVVSSSIFFHYGDFFHYHLSGRTVNADNSVNNYLLDEAIKFAQGLGAKNFHFGGGRSSDPNDSLLKFKSNFSKTRLPFYIGKKIHNQEIYNEVVRQWETRFPEKKEKYMNHLLKYRF
ncbi:MAG: GNAT family N-acetyltransferase [Tenuifilaceae bacterium]